MSSPEERRAASLRLADEAVSAAETAALPGDFKLAEMAALASLRDHGAGQWDDLAADLDARADVRDQEAHVRDVTASARGRRARESAGDPDPGWADRFTAAGNRDDAVGDRGESRRDRKSAGASRRRAAAQRKRAAHERAAAIEAAQVARATIEQLRSMLDTRIVIAQAAGLLMGRHALTYATAVHRLETLSQNTDTKMLDVAARLIAAHVAAPTASEPAVLTSRSASLARGEVR
jgi:hypothetical protein